MAEPGRYEGIRQAQLLGLHNLPGRPLRQCCGEPGPVFCRTEADGGDQTTKSAPVARCFRHLLPAAALCPFVFEGALLLPLHLCSSAAQQPSYRPQLGAGSREAVLFVSTPARPVKRQSKRHPWDGRTRGTGFCSSGDGEYAHSPWMMSPLLRCFCCSATGSGSASGTQTFKKAVSYVSGSQEGTDSSVRDTVSTPPSPFPFVSRQQVPVRGRDASSLTPCPTGKPGKCRTTQSEPTSGRTVFWVESLCSTSLPHSGYVGGSPSPACSVSGGLASSPQTGLMAHKNYQTWLCDSVRLASSQVQGRSVHYCAEPGCSRLANGDCGPTSKGCDRAGPSS